MDVFDSENAARWDELLGLDVYWPVSGAGSLLERLGLDPCWDERLGLAS